MTSVSDVLSAFLLATVGSSPAAVSRCVAAELVSAVQNHNLTSTGPDHSDSRALIYFFTNRLISGQPIRHISLLANVKSGNRQVVARTLINQAV